MNRYSVISNKEFIYYNFIYDKDVEKQFDTLKKATKYLFDGIYENGMYDVIIVDNKLGREVSFPEMELFIDEYCETI